MATEVKFRGGTTAQHAAFTGAAPEMTVDTDLDRVVIHDGATAGGFPTPNFKDLQNQAMVYAAATGTNTLTVTYTPAPAAYVAGQRFVFKAANNNTAAVTLNVNGLGAKSIKKNGGVDELGVDDIVAGQVVAVQYDGTNFQVVSASSGATKEFFVPVTGISAGATETVDGNWPVALVDATGESAHTAFFVPADFTTIIDAVALIIVLETGVSTTITVNISWSPVGGDKSANSATDPQTGQTWTTNRLREIDLSTALSSLAAGDYVAVEMLAGNRSYEMVGVRFKYS